jgi:hypothetical protein
MLNQVQHDNNASMASAIFNGFCLYILLTAVSDSIGIWFDALCGYLSIWFLIRFETASFLAVTLVIVVIL